MLMVLCLSSPALGRDARAAAPMNNGIFAEPRQSRQWESYRMPARYYRRRAPRLARAPYIRYRRDYGPPAPSYSAAAFRSRKRWGFDGGLLMEKQNSNGSLLGLNYAPGLRLAFFFPTGQNFAIKPSLGLFLRSDGTQSVGVSERRVELGANLLYAPQTSSKAGLLLGLATRLDLNLTKISAFEDSDTALSFAFRLGPTIGTEIVMGAGSSLTLEFDTTFDIGNSFRLHPALTFGLRFLL